MSDRPRAWTVIRRLTCGLVVGCCAVGAAFADGASASRKVQRFYAFLYMGDFATDESAAVLDHVSDSFSFGGGSGFRFHGPFALELDLHMSSTAYDLPRGFSPDQHADDKLELTTLGAFGSVKVGHRLGRVRLEGGGGVGFGMIDVSLANPHYLVPSSLETQFSLLSQALAGFNVRVTRRSYLGIDYRRLFAHRTIDFHGEEIDGGGESFNLVYRFGF